LIASLRASASNGLASYRRAGRRRLRHLQA